MGKPVVGEVVVLPFPLTNLQPGKRRPALVVADLAGDDLIRCQITSRARSDSSSVPLTVKRIITVPGIKLVFAAPSHWPTTVKYLSAR